MLEALWSVQFISNLQVFGSGVVIFETGRVLGGDATFYYVGDYETKDGQVDGVISITNYNGSNLSIVGPGNNFKIKLSGKINTPQMELSGFRIDAPNIKVAVRLTKRAELPNPS